MKRNEDHGQVVQRYRQQLLDGEEISHDIVAQMQVYGVERPLYKMLVTLVLK